MPDKNVLALRSEQQKQMDKLANTETKGMKGGSEPWSRSAEGRKNANMEAGRSVEPGKIHTVAISTQHGTVEGLRSHEVAVYSCPEETAPSMEEMNKLFEEKVIWRCTVIQQRLYIPTGKEKTDA